jgi:hypothetical protein
VCSIRDIASAQRMGAALTYARRYALFALVGIAGEDDLDAPDLGANPNPTAELARPPDLRKQSNGQPTTGRTVGNQGNVPTPSRSALGAQLSASLRESLIEKMAAINSADEAAAWAHRNLPAKNTLTAADAKLVEEAFAARLFQISDASDETRDDPTSDDGSAAPTPGNPDPAEPPHAAAEQRVMQSRESNAGTSQKPSKVAKRQSRTAVVRALGKTVRLRDKDHRKFVLRQPCLVCGRVPSDPHHLTFIQRRALGRRVSDEFTVPVCRVHHRELHRSGNEAAWWRKLNIDPLPVALKLWQRTRADGELFASSEGDTRASAANTPDVSAEDRSNTSRDPIAHPKSAV